MAGLVGAPMGPVRAAWAARPRQAPPARARQPHPTASPYGAMRAAGPAAPISITLAMAAQAVRRLRAGRRPRPTRLAGGPISIHAPPAAPVVPAAEQATQAAPAASPAAPSRRRAVTRSMHRSGKPAGRAVVAAAAPMAARAPAAR